MYSLAGLKDGISGGREVSLYLRQALPLREFDCVRCGFPESPAAEILEYLLLKLISESLVLSTGVVLKIEANCKAY